MIDFERVIFMDNYFISVGLGLGSGRLGLELGLRFAYDEFERVIFMDNYFICDYRVRVRVCL